MATDRSTSLCAAFKAIIVRLAYAANGLVLTFFVHKITEESRVFAINALVIPSLIEVAITLKYKKKGEWTWVIPSVLIYLLWMVPCIIILEIYALNFRIHARSATGMSSCPIMFNDECRTTVVEAMEGEDALAHDGIYGTNLTNHVLNPDTHDLSRRYSMLFQQIMMLIIIFGRWMAPKGQLSRDQLSSLLLALTAMSLDMLEFSTDSLSIEAVACDKIYVGFIITVWCWSLLQIPLGLTAVKQRKPRVAGPVESRDSSDGSSGVETKNSNRWNWKAYCCCCCESEIWSLMVSICMQDGPYLLLRLYIMFSTGYVGETLIFFAAKNALIVMLQAYRVIVKVNQNRLKRRERYSVSGHQTLPDAKPQENGGFTGDEGSNPECVVVTISKEGSNVSDDGDASQREDALQVEGANRQQNGGFTSEGRSNPGCVVVTISKGGSDVSDDGEALQGEDALQAEEATRSIELSKAQDESQNDISGDVGFHECTDIALKISDGVTLIKDEDVCEELNDNENVSTAEH